MDEGERCLFVLVYICVTIGIGKTIRHFFFNLFLYIHHVFVISTLPLVSTSHSLFLFPNLLDIGDILFTTITTTTQYPTLVADAFDLGGYTLLAIFTGFVVSRQQPQQMMSWYLPFKILLISTIVSIISLPIALLLEDPSQSKSVT